MQDTAKMPRNPEGERRQCRPLVDDELADQLLGKAQAEGVELLGPDGLLSVVAALAVSSADWRLPGSRR